MDHDYWIDQDKFSQNNTQNFLCHGFYILKFIIKLNLSYLLKLLYCYEHNICSEVNFNYLI